jgi:hypothetical protein
MAGDSRSTARRNLGDILVDVGYEAAVTGERMADVILGPRQGAGGSRAPRPASAPRQPSGAHRPPPKSDRGVQPHSIVGKFADLTADVMDRMGDTFRDIAEHERFARDSDVPQLCLRGRAGSVVTADFRFTNTGSTALKDVTFAATDLLGPGDPIDARNVGFEHGEAREQRIERMGPGRETWVTVGVAIPDDTPAGEYHGVIAAKSPPPTERDAAEAGPVGAWALVELQVLATDASHGR